MAAENEMLSRMEQLMAAKLEMFEQRILTSQRQISQAELSQIKEGLSNGETYTFRKKGNEEQHKVNTQVLGKMREAEGFLSEATQSGSHEAVITAHKKISEGMSILSHRQKLIKLADSSDSGWRVVHEYEAHPLADDSDDEKKIQRAQMKADRKLLQERRARTRRFAPYTNTRGPVTTAVSASSAPQPGQGSSGGRKPGMCFRCGRPGHWRQECKTLVVPDSGMANTEQKISKALLNAFESVGENCFQDPKLTSPVGKLNECFNHWKEAGANEYILDVVSHGYKLLFREAPEKTVLKNNKSARDNPSFVTNEIKNLLQKGCVSEVQNLPHVVNPLTVAYGKSGKPRLVLDCRHINPHLFKYKCCFEDQSVAKCMFSTGDFMFSFDIRSAYHHVMNFPEHRTYLGMSWEINGQVRYFVFNVLPFGISTAGHIYTKLMRVIVTKWRALGFRVVVFLDDGLGGVSSFTTAKDASAC